MWERRSPDDLRPGHSGRAAASAVVSIAVAVVIVVAVAVFATRSGGDDVVSVPQLEVAVEWFDVLFAALAILAVVGLGVLVAS